VTGNIPSITGRVMHNYDTKNNTTISDEERKQALEELFAFEQPLTDAEIDELARIDSARHGHPHEV